jgi:hypothetical protein
MALQNNHRGATETMVAYVRLSQPDGPSGHTAIGIDECAYQGPVLEAVHRFTFLAFRGSAAL